MKHKTRKLIFPALAAILISLLLTCTPFDPPDDYDDYEDYEDVYTDVEYSQDGSLVTIYLDGSTPVRQSRALTRDLAILGHDLFEVAFVYRNAAGQTTVARAVWETGHAAGITGVYRTAGGIDYSTVRRVSTMGNNQGSAIMFVGKKSDRTLLAVGRLAASTNKDGTPGTTSITPDTASVTFAVAALRAGVNNNATSSSFRTDAKVPAPPLPDNYGNVGPTYTEIIPVIIGDKGFPLFWLDPLPRYVHGEYTFGVVGGNLNSDYKDGILQKSNIELCYPTATVNSYNYNRIPRYPFLNESGEYGGYRTALNDIYYEYEGIDGIGGNPPLSITGITPVQAPNNAAAGDPFDNPVQFLIGPTRADRNGWVFAFSFQIPVYPLTNIDGRAGGFSWFLRPGYDSYRDDLDDGMGGTGGAILMGTGEFEEVGGAEMHVAHPPFKTRYNGTGTDPWYFALDGIEVYLRQGKVVEKLDLSTGVWFVVDTIPNDDPDDPAGHRALLDGNNIQTILQAAAVNGIVKVTVEYHVPPVDGSSNAPFTQIGSTPNAYGVRNPLYSPGDVKTAVFNIYYVPLPAGISFDIPNSHRHVLTNTEDGWRLQGGHTGTGKPGINGAANNDVFLIALFHNFDINALTSQAGVNLTYIIVAGAPGIIIGNSGAGAINNNGQNNRYYIGIWPFDEVLSADGMAFESQPFYLNAGGSYTAVPVDGSGKPNGNPPASTGWFISGTSPAAKNVQYAGVDIFNLTRLYTNAAGTGPGP